MQVLENESIGKVTVGPSLIARVWDARSIDTTTPGLSMAWVFESTTIGRKLFFKLFWRKISAKLVEMTALKPKSFNAQTACSRELPQPKLSPATSISAPFLT